MKALVARAVLPVAIALALQACSTAGAYFGETTPPGNQVLLIGNQGEPRSLDPHKTAGVPESTIMINLYDCLTTYDPHTAAPIPCVAKSWESNADATVWTFHLRDDARWTDGLPVTADDFVYSWRRLADPETAAPYANLAYYIKNGQAINDSQISDTTQLGVRAIDPLTLEVTMERPTAFFLAMTPHPAFAPLPRRAIDKWGDQWVTPEHHVSNGPYRLVKRIAYDRIVLEKWDQHWDAARCRITRAIFLPIDEQNTAVNLYKANEIYVLAGGGQGVPTSFVLSLIHI